MVFPAVPTKKSRAVKRRAAKKRAAKKRSLTAADRQNLRLLADSLGRLLPLEGYRSQFSLKQVAKRYSLTAYVPSKSANKKEAFATFLEKLVCYKPRTLKKVVREILPVAIEKRHAKGDPVLEPEALSLSRQLYEIGVDLRKEIRDLKLPRERPKVVPPPIAIQKILDTFVLHPVMLPDCKEMFTDGHINESVRKALERFERRVQELSALTGKQGTSLMGAAFSEVNPLIKLNPLATIQDRNEQEGFKLLTMGMMQWWRNNLSHGDEPQLPHHEALGRLIQVSNLFHRLDQRADTTSETGIA
jgi:uncharacterized protein (TIGR02391 family)